jgi:hypothetical protein
MKQQGADGSERSVSVTGADEALQTSCDGCGGSIVFRVGTVVAWVNLNPDGHGAPRTSSIGAFASALAERIRQVFNGQRPTVSVR